MPLSQSIKRFFVNSRLDRVFAGAYSQTHFSAFKRLIPPPEHYAGVERTVKRRGALFHLAPEDLSQWVIFADSGDNHLQAAIETMKPEGVIIDGGANVGHFSIPLAAYLRKTGIDKKVISFEPNPRIFGLLERNIQLNPDLRQYIVAKPFGLGEKKKEIQIHAPLRNSGAGTILEEYNHEPHDEVKSMVYPLDDLITEPVCFIKLDVEGYEYFVLKGAQRIIKHYRPPIYFETVRGQPYQLEIFQMLMSFGYKFSVESKGKFKRVDPESIIGYHKMKNILAEPRLQIQ